MTVGGSIERHVIGALAGPTFLCILTEQFYRTRVGDRFFYENGDKYAGFTPGTYTEDVPFFFFAFFQWYILLLKINWRKYAKQVWHDYCATTVIALNLCNPRPSYKFRIRKFCENFN